MLLNLTSFSEVSRPFHGGRQIPINVARGGVCCTLNTRYDAPSLPNDILTLAHFPRTVILYEYD